MDTRGPPFSFLSVKMVPFQDGTRPWTLRTPLLRSTTEQTMALTAPSTRAQPSASPNGHNFLFATDFHTGKVHTFDENFQQVNPNGFVDPDLPAGYAPFGIRTFNNEVFVTYVIQDHAREDDVACAGCGFVNVFDTSGNFLRRLISNGNLNAPWGLALVEG